MNKIHTLLATAILTITFSSVNAETTFQDVKQELAETMSTIGEYSADQKDDFVEGAGNVMDKIDRQMTVMEAKIEENWEEMSEASKEKSKASMNALREKREDMAEWYEGAKDSTADAWDETKAGFAEAYDAVKNGFDDAEKEFN